MGHNHLLDTRKYVTVYNGVDVRKVESRTAKVDKEGLRKELGLNEGERIINMALRATADVLSTFTMERTPDCCFSIYDRLSHHIGRR